MFVVYVEEFIVIEVWTNSQILNIKFDNVLFRAINFHDFIIFILDVDHGLRLGRDVLYGVMEYLRGGLQHIF